MPAERTQLVAGVIIGRVFKIGGAGRQHFFDTFNAHVPATNNSTAKSNHTNRAPAPVSGNRQRNTLFRRRRRYFNGQTIASLRVQLPFVISVYVTQFSTRSVSYPPSAVQPRTRLISSTRRPFDNRAIHMMMFTASAINLG